MVLFSKKRKAIISLAVSLTLAGALFLVPAQAEKATDPAPKIAAVGTQKGKVLFDNTHGQTAGSADWVIDGGFSDFANGVAKQGNFVSELRKTAPITYDDLKEYDVFVIPEANIPFKVTEQAAMLEYVQKGGSIFFIGDHYNADRNMNRWDGNESFNGYRRGAWNDPTKGMNAGEKASAAMQDVQSSDWLGQNFGIRFRYNALGDITTPSIVEKPAQAFGITKGVQTVEMHAGSTLAILDPNKAKGIVYLPKTTSVWGNKVDKGNYAGGGIEEGPYVAVAKVGLGKAAFIGDSSAVEDATPKYKDERNGKVKTTYDGFKEGDDGVLLINLMNWLGKHETYKSFDQVQGLELSLETKLITAGPENEIPQNSIEPKNEPWSQPSGGYKWYDPSTFANGAYGK